MPVEQTASPMMHSQLIPMAIIMLIFYFLILKPQKEKQKQQKDMLANVKKNDQVVTSAGIHGTVLNIKDKTVIVRIDDNVKIEIDKEAIATIVKAST